jgi:hypothetical protein
MVPTNLGLCTSSCDLKSVGLGGDLAPPHPVPLGHMQVRLGIIELTTLLVVEDMEENLS